jgi:hypothetical protein
MQITQHMHLIRGIERLRYGEMYNSSSSCETGGRKEKTKKMKMREERKERRGTEFRGPVGDVAPNPLMRRKDDDSNAGSSLDREVRLRGIMSSLGKTQQEIGTGALTRFLLLNTAIRNRVTCTWQLTPNMQRTVKNVTRKLVIKRN